MARGLVYLEDEKLICPYCGGDGIMDDKQVPVFGKMLWASCTKCSKTGSYKTFLPDIFDFNVDILKVKEDGSKHTRIVVHGLKPGIKNFFWEESGTNFYVVSNRLVNPQKKFRRGSSYELSRNLQPALTC